MLGAEVYPVESGNKTLKDATNEAIRDWCCHPQDTFYIIGSTVGPHPIPTWWPACKASSAVKSRNSSWKRRTRLSGLPDGLCRRGVERCRYHLPPHRRRTGQNIPRRGRRPRYRQRETAATIHCGSLGIIHGSRTLVMQDEDGQIIEPYSISAGLDYPGIGPLHANLAQSTGPQSWLSTTKKLYGPHTNSPA